MSHMISPGLVCKNMKDLGRTTKYVILYSYGKNVATEILAREAPCAKPCFPPRPTLSIFVFFRSFTYVCVCFLPIHSGHQVRWTYQPGPHRRKVTQDFTYGWTFFSFLIIIIEETDQVVQSFQVKLLDRAWTCGGNGFRTDAEIYHILIVYISGQEEVFGLSTAR